MSHNALKYEQEGAPSTSGTPQDLSTQISSVDFATLSKQTTNSSRGSSLATNNSKKRSLSRFFSRRKTSSDTFSFRPDEFKRADFEIPDEQEIDKPQKLSSHFTRSGSPRSILKLERKTSNKPDVAAQTTSQHRHIFSRDTQGHTSIQDSGTSKKASSPPVYLNNLFHRPQSSTTDHKNNESIDSRESFQTGPSISSKRSTVQLSSQSSNSFITDRAMAMTYNFTIPGNGGGNDEQPHEGTSLLDLHRRYMVSADLYIQKLHKSAPEEPFPPSNNPSSTKEKLRLGLQLYDEHYTKALSELYEIIKPMLFPTKVGFVPKGNPHQQVLLSTEQVSSFVEERLFRARRVLSSMDQDEQSATKFKSGPRGGDVFNNFLSPEGQEDEISDLESKEFLLKLYSFFIKCCHTLAENFMRKKVSEFPKVFLESASSGAGFKMDNSSFNFTRYLENWNLIAQAWNYFNSRVRFYLLHIFLPAEVHLDYLSCKDPSTREFSRPINLEKDILHAFRDTFIIPQLRERTMLLPFQKSSESLLKSPMSTQEKNLFTNKNSSTARSLTNCFGVLSSCATRDLLKPEDSQPDDTLFSEFVRCVIN
ncbi:hypothetical protein JCM33374_g3448 [Metschnikowia sp. JCM 33374]|nr:hypothetical protein JCM33374_g3448 [Metschnikowia sp. JCM 33374]